MNRKNKLFNLFKISQQINIAKLEYLADLIIKFFDPSELAYTEDRLKSAIYDYYTLESVDTISSFYENKTKELSSLSKDERKNDPLMRWWSSLKSAMNDSAGRRGWVENDNNPEWIQYEKIGRSSQKSDHSYKKYLTFKKVDDNGNLTTSFYENYAKLPILLSELSSQSLSGELTFKISSHPLKALRHKDSVVIHFKDMADLPKIESAVANTGFDLVSREKVGRTDIGVDSISGATGKKGSDSQIAAERAVENIKMNKTLLEEKLKNPSTKMEGLSAINHILNKVMMESSHRNN